MVDRFADQKDERGHWQKMRAVQYKGDIQTYLAKLEEINSRAGATGEPFKGGHHLRNCAGDAPGDLPALPNNDTDLINAVREIGIIEGETLISAAQIRKPKTGAPAGKTEKSTAPKKGKKQKKEQENEQKKEHETERQRSRIRQRRPLLRAEPARAFPI